MNYQMKSVSAEATEQRIPVGSFHPFGPLSFFFHASSNMSTSNFQAQGRLLPLGADHSCSSLRPAAVHSCECFLLQLHLSQQLVLAVIEATSCSLTTVATAISAKCITSPVDPHSFQKFLTIQAVKGLQMYTLIYSWQRCKTAPTWCGLIEANRLSSSLFAEWTHDTNSFQCVQPVHLHKRSNSRRDVSWWKVCFNRLVVCIYQSRTSSQVNRLSANHYLRNLTLQVLGEMLGTLIGKFA